MGWLATAIAVLGVMPTVTPVVVAQEVTPPTTLVAAPLEQTTEVHGTPPDLTGRWLVVAHLALKSTVSSITTAALWNVTAPDGTPRVEVRQVALPPTAKAAMLAANKDKKPWDPTPDDLAALAAQWETLPADERPLASIATAIRTPEHFDDAVKQDEAMKGARWLVTQTMGFQPGPARPIREVIVMGVEQDTPDGFAGAYASVTVAAAPFPIPISFKGTFRMYRLGGAAPRGFLARVLDVFSGCGRGG